MFARKSPLILEKVVVCLWLVLAGPSVQSADRTVFKNDVESLSFGWNGFRVEGFSGQVELATWPGFWKLTIQKGKFDKLVIPGAPHWLPLRNGHLEGAVVMDKKKRRLELDRVTLRAPPWGSVSGSGTVPLDEAGTRLTLRGQGLRPGSLKVVQGALPKGFSLKCAVNAAVTLKNNSQGEWSWKGNLALEEGFFSEPSYLYSGENLALTSSFEGRYSGSGTGENLSLATEVSLNQGETLLKRFYFDLGKTPLDLQLKVAWANGFQSLRVQRLQVHLSSVLRCALEGSIADLEGMTGLQWHLSAPIQPLGPFMRVFLREPYGEQYPWLGRFRWEGDWQWDLSLNGALEAPRIRGGVRLNETRLQSAENATRIGKIDGYAPFDFDFSKTPPPPDTGDPTKGYLHLEGVRFWEFEWPRLLLDFAAFRNGFRLTRPAAVPVGDGKLEIEQLVVEDVLNPSSRGEVVLAPSGVQPGFLLEKWLGEPVGASLRNERWELGLEGDHLKSRTPLKLDVFSGTVHVSHFAVSRLLRPGQTLALDAHWNGIDLKELTEITDFGRITGRMKGSLDGFRMSYGMPMAFEMVLESVPTEGVPQRISVTAVDNLAQIGTAQSPFQGVAGGLMTTFFQDFYYKKIGIRCRLKNDYFRLRGLIHEGSNEYLVKGSALRGVNIVNRNPDNRIAWEDMVRRLKRIQRSGGTSESR